MRNNTVRWNVMSTGPYKGQSSEQPTDRVYYWIWFSWWSGRICESRLDNNHALYNGEDKRERLIDVNIRRIMLHHHYHAILIVRFADIEYLEKHALRAILYNNDCFGLFDATVRIETLDPSTHTSPWQRQKSSRIIYDATISESRAGFRLLWIWNETFGTYWKRSRERGIKSSLAINVEYRVKSWNYSTVSLLGRRHWL